MTARATPSTPSTSSTSSKGRQTNILIVDDERAVLNFVDRVLRDAGYKTMLAESGEQAIALAEQAPPFELLVTDVRMIGMNGDEVARRLRERDPRLKVLYLTGFSDELFKRKHPLWEDEAFLDKPCTSEGIREAVSMLLYGRVHPPEA